MGEHERLTATQEASRELSEAVFADPELRERFELMAKESANRVPVPDDFAWLSSDAQEDEFSRFESFTRRLLAVPKSAIDAVRGKGVSPSS